MPVLQFLFEMCMWTISLCKYHAVDILEHDRLPRHGLLQVCTTAIGAVKSCVIDHLNVQCVQHGIPLVAQVLLDGLARYGTGDRESDAKTITRQLLRKPETDPETGEEIPPEVGGESQGAMGF